MVVRSSEKHIAFVFKTEYDSNRYQPSRVHSDACHKTMVLMFTVVKTSNAIKKFKLSNVSTVAIKFEILREKQLPQGKGKVLHSFMMATDPSLNYQQNVEVMDFMEAEVLRLAQSKGFAGIFTTNTSPLTQVCVLHPVTNISCYTSSHFCNVSPQPSKKILLHTVQA